MIQYTTMLEVLRICQQYKCRRPFLKRYHALDRMKMFTLQKVILLQVSCQRNVLDHFPELHSRANALSKLLQDFFEENIRGVFSRNNYIFDCYVTSQNRVSV